MQAKTGYIYYIKDEYFELAEKHNISSGLMKNNKDGHNRPSYYCVKDKKTELLWIIPLSSKIEKYQAIIKNETKKHGQCSKVVIAQNAGRKSAFLIQNAFPVLERYIDHVFMIKGKIIEVNPSTQRLVKSLLERVRGLYRNGIKICYTEIDKLEALMLAELQQ